MVNPEGAALILLGLAFAVLALCGVVAAVLEQHRHRAVRWGGAALLCLILAAGFLTLSYVVSPPGLA